MAWFMTWSELRDAPFGTKLVFPNEWDIYPYCVVPAGTKAVVARNRLASDEHIIALLTDNDHVHDSLREWNGCIEFAPMNDGYTWSDESPVALDDEGEPDGEE